MEDKTNFIEFCEETKRSPMIDKMHNPDHFRNELDLCIQEWKEGVFPRGRTKIGDGLARLFGMYDSDTEDFFGRLIHIGDLHGLRAAGRVWSNRCY